MKKLVKTVLELPAGEVFLAGLDQNLEDSAWQQIDETHPQFELKQLLDYLQIDRLTIPCLLPPANQAREKLISEIMRPAAASDYWRQLAGSLDTKAVDGINLIECDDPRTEALTIAVLIRRALETPERTKASARERQARRLGSSIRTSASSSSRLR